MRHDRFLALVRSFPVLRNYAPTVDGPDDAVDLLLIDAWAAHDRDEEMITRICQDGRAPFPGDGAREAARFVLNLFDSGRAWKCGPFSIGRALRVWDQEQIRAFQAFVADPFLP